MKIFKISTRISFLHTFTLNRCIVIFCIEYSRHVSERKCDPNCVSYCCYVSFFQLFTSKHSVRIYVCIGKKIYYIIIVVLIGYITLSEYTTTNLYLWQQVLSGTTCWNEILLYYVHHMSIQIKTSLNWVLESGIILSFYTKVNQ